MRGVPICVTPSSCDRLIFSSLAVSFISSVGLCSPDSILSEVLARGDQCCAGIERNKLSSDIGFGMLVWAGVLLLDLHVEKSDSTIYFF